MRKKTVRDLLRFALLVVVPTGFEAIYGFVSVAGSNMAAFDRSGSFFRSISFAPAYGYSSSQVASGQKKSETGRDQDKNEVRENLDIESETDGEFGEENIKESREADPYEDDTPYEELTEEGADEETGESPEEVRQNFSSGAFVWVGESKPFSRWGAGYSVMHPPYVVSSYGLGTAEFDYQQVEDGLGYDLAINSVTVFADASYFPFYTVPVKFLAGLGISHVALDYKKARFITEASGRSASSDKQLLSLYLGAGFQKYYPSGYMFGVDFLVTSRSAVVSGSKPDLNDAFDDDTVKVLQTVRITPPLNFTFGYMF